MSSDELDQLETEQCPDGTTIEYTYDGFGNRTKVVKTKDGQSTTTNADYNEANQLIRFGSETMRYDANGNRKIKVNKGIYNRKKHYGNGTRKSVRDAVLKRDNYTCQYCGRKGGKLEVDHNPSLKQHYYKKGYAMSRKARIKYANNPKYLKTACQRCNRSKQERYYPDEWRP